MVRPSQCTKKYGVPLLAGAWVSPLKAITQETHNNNNGDGDGDGEEGVVVVAGGGGSQRNGVPNCILLAEYDCHSSTLTDAQDTFDTGDDLPLRLAGFRENVVCSFEKDCRVFLVQREDGGR